MGLLHDDGPALYDVEVERSEHALTATWRTSGEVSTRLEVVDHGFVRGTPLRVPGAWVASVAVEPWEAVAWRVVISGFPGAPIASPWVTSPSCFA